MSRFFFTCPISGCISRLLICIASLLCLVAARAQSAPDAGQLLQQTDRNRLPALPPAMPSERSPKAASPQKIQQGAVVTVQRFDFVGNTLLGTQELRTVVASFTGNPIGFTELQSAVAAVSNAYRNAGWLVRAFLPAQEVLDGVVQIQVVEARFGGSRIEGAQPVRIKPSLVLGYFEAAQPKGQLLNMRQLDRALLLADDLPGISVTGNLEEGAVPAQTNLILRTTDEPLWFGYLAADNTGARSTGATRYSANLFFNSPTGWGDAWSLTAVYTEGSDYVRMSASFPLGARGWRVGANASTLSYLLVAPEFSSLGGKGTSDTVGLEATYPILRSRLANVYATLAFDKKDFDNQANASTSSKYRSDVFTVGLSGNRFDEVWGGGISAVSLLVTSGHLNLDGSPNRGTDAATTRTAGQFNKLRYSVSRQQTLSQAITLYAMLSGQRADKNLDSSEKFYLGGAGGVRAYPSSEGGGAEGDMLNVELRWAAARGLTLTSFYDFGKVRINRDNHYSGGAARNEFDLKGVGVSLSWQTGFGGSSRLTWARRLGTNANPAFNGNDQDGSLVRNRFWLSYTQAF
jgi:hemolysin activation/secretion protein